MLSPKILELRNKAHETKAANNIMEMLDKLEKSNNELSKRRWVWELIQNAKDAVNSSGKVDISITFDEVNGVLDFKHNGKLFTTENLVFLIEQTSSKDRDADGNEQKKTTGKFGTGFLTTHLLSRKVNVSGYLQDDNETSCQFSIELDRTGRDKQTIISSIAASCKQLDENVTPVNETDINENDFNTAFIYQLSPNGIKTAQEGVQNLIVTVPYVLAFVPEINSITVNNEQYVFRRSTEPPIALDNAFVLEVIETRGGTSKTRYICVANNEDISVAVEIGRGENRKFICEYSHLLPKLFCDFPLIGTEDFAFPVVVNSSRFNPNEPRDGVWLNDNDKDADTIENKAILEQATALYKNLLTYLNNNEYEGVYNITVIKNPVRKDWLSLDWINNNIILELKSFVEKEEIIPTYSGGKVSLLDMCDDSCVHLMNDSNKELREQVWELTSSLFPNEITKKEEIEHWHNSLWSDCHNFGMKNLIRIIGEIYNIEGLSEQLPDNIDVFGWLNKLYSVIFANQSLFALVQQEGAKLFPNQEEILCSLDKLRIGEGIDDVHMDLAQMIGVNATSWLAHAKIVNSISAHLNKYSLEDLAKAMIERYDDFEYGHEEFCLRFLCLRRDGQHLTEEHKKLSEFVSELYPDEVTDVFNVHRYIAKLLNKSLFYWREKIMRDISSCHALSDFSDTYNIDNGVDFVNRFVSHLNKHSYENRLADNNVTVFLNQNDVFVSKESLFIEDEVIDDIFKDICKHMGDDIRRFLLHNDIFLELRPERNYGLNNIAENIIKFVEGNANRHIEDSELRTDFNRLMMWLMNSANASVTKKYFGRLKRNIHWFYNHDEIASNMEKADRYESLLVRLGITDENRLEELLQKAQQAENDEAETEPAIVTQDLLAQYGISTEKALKDAIDGGMFGVNFVHTSGQFDGYFTYVQSILERSKKNVIEHLKAHKDYDLSDIDEIAPTVFVAKKKGDEIYLIIRPSDREQVIIYYQSEFDILDYERDWELWVENGIDKPEKLTFGKILKRTGMNRIPLKKVF